MGTWNVPKILAAKLSKILYFWVHAKKMSVKSAKEQRQPKFLFLQMSAFPFR